MPATRKQKARKSRGQDIISDIENLDIMLGESHFDREESEDSILDQRVLVVTLPKILGEIHILNTRDNRSGNSVDHGQNSADTRSHVWVPTL